MFCKHEWCILSEKTTESTLQQAKGLGMDIRITEHTSLTVWERKYIQIVTCKKCGALKRFVETI